MNINIKKVSLTATIPTYGTPGAAGLDLHADLLFPIKLRPGVRFTCPTGIAIELPDHLEAQIRPRSGLAKKHGITVLNAPGTIDSDFVDEICVIIFNASEDEEFEIKPGDRIAQMVIAPFIRASLIETVELKETERGEGGFGSTGN